MNGSSPSPRSLTAWCGATYIEEVNFLRTVDTSLFQSTHQHGPSSNGLHLLTLGAMRPRPPFLCVIPGPNLLLPPSCSKVLGSLPLLPLFLHYLTPKYPFLCRSPPPTGSLEPGCCWKGALPEGWWARLLQAGRGSCRSHLPHS